MPNFQRKTALISTCPHCAQNPRASRTDIKSRDKKDKAKDAKGEKERQKLRRKKKEAVIKKAIKDLAKKRKKNDNDNGIVRPSAPAGTEKTEKRGSEVKGSADESTDVSRISKKIAYQQAKLKELRIGEEMLASLFLLENWALGTLGRNHGQKVRSE